MKNVIAAMALATIFTSMSVNAFESSKNMNVVTTHNGATLATVTGCGAGACKAEAQHILADGQDYILSGKVSAYLEAKIKDAQAISPEMSEAEALEILVNASQEILN